MNHPDGNIELRDAAVTDIQILQHWDKQEHTVSAAPNDFFNWEYEIPRKFSWRKLLIASLNQRPIGFIQIIDAAEEETHYWQDAAPGLKAIDIWIGEANDLGKGYGTVMMRLALEICFDDEKTTAVLIDPLASNTRAQIFYERMGFEFLEYRQFDEDHCKVYLISREKFDSIRKKEFFAHSTHH